MMSSEQRKIVSRAYEHLLESETRGWDSLDEYIDYLEYLDNDQLHREADVLYSYHSKGRVRCTENHSVEKCFIPLLIDAVTAILDLYKESGSLHARNKYILQYYIAMNQSGLILVEDL